MSAKERLVYSTGKGRICPKCGWPAEDCHCSSSPGSAPAPVPEKIRAKLRLEKRVSGKAVTVVDGLPRNGPFLDAVLKELKKACGTGGGDAVVSSNTYPSLPLIDPDTLEFEMNVDGLVSSGGLGGPAILPQSLAKMSQMTRAFPEKSFSGIGGIADFNQALNYFLLGCGTVQVCTAAMLDHAVGPNVVKRLLQGMSEFLEKNAHRGWKRLEDFRGLRRDRIVGHSQIRRPADSDYQGGHEPQEGYAEPARA